jgi:hypothetical protein
MVLVLGCGIGAPICQDTRLDGLGNVLARAEVSHATLVDLAVACFRTGAVDREIVADTTRLAGLSHPPSHSVGISFPIPGK